MSTTIENKKTVIQSSFAGKSIKLTIEEVSGGPSPDPTNPDPNPQPQPNPNPQPDPAEGEVDSQGIKWLAAKGAQTMIKQTRDKADDYRWSGNVKGLARGFEATMIVQFDEVAKDGHFAMKHGGPNHSGPGSDKGVWYDTGVRRNGDIQLQYERPHPKNHDFKLSDTELFIKNVGKPLTKNTIGQKWIVEESEGIRRCRLFVDDNPLTNGRPTNNWQKVYDFIDKGQVLKDYVMPDEQDCEIRISGVKKVTVYGGGLHVRAIQ